MKRVLVQILPRGKFDNVSPVRSKTMRAIRGRGNRSTEKRLIAVLARAGVRGWKVRPRGIAGNPDFVFPTARVAVFVDGCFWHGCPECGHIPRANRPYWAAKIAGNRRRDAKVDRLLQSNSIRVLRIWEHELRADSKRLVSKIQKRTRWTRSTPT